MGIDLANYKITAPEMVKTFWSNRESASQKQMEAGKADAGNRGSVTGGKNMDGFIDLIVDLVKNNGLPEACIYKNRSVVTLPGYFRPTKLWDLLVVNEKRLIAAIELKSQVGSFGNNFNNRTEEAIGTAHDFWVAYREGAFGNNPKPFVGWLMLVEDAPESRTPVKDASPHFPVFKEFQGASYLKRYDLLCERLIKEQLYTAASVITSPKSAITDGTYSEMQELTGLKNFVTLLASHIAAESARLE